MTPSSSYLFPRPVSRESFFGADSFDRPLSRSSSIFPAGANGQIGQLNESNPAQYPNGVGGMWPVNSTPEPLVAHDAGTFSSQLFVDPFRRPSSGLNGASTPINPPNSAFFPTNIPRLSVEFSDTIPHTRESAPPSPTNVKSATPETKLEKDSPTQESSTRSQVKRSSLPHPKTPTSDRNSKSKSKSNNSPEAKPAAAQPDSTLGRGKSKSEDTSKEEEDDDASAEGSDNEGEEESSESRDACESPMECGTVRKGVRILNEHVEFFGKEVELYTATADPKKRILVRASQLAELFNCATNKVGMYLARRRHMTDGLYQATCFKFKPQGRTGLKSGGYFLSLEVCEQFKQHYSKDAQGGNNGISKDKYPPIKSTRVASRITANQQQQQQQQAAQQSPLTTSASTITPSTSDSPTRPATAPNSSKVAATKSSSKPASPMSVSEAASEDKAKSKITASSTTSQSTANKAASAPRTSGQKRTLSPEPSAEFLTSAAVGADSSEPLAKKPKGTSPPPSSSPPSASSTTSEIKPKSNSIAKSAGKQSRPRSPVVEAETTTEDEKPSKKSKLSAKDSETKRGAKSPSPLPTKSVVAPVEYTASVIDDQLIESDLDSQRAKRKSNQREKTRAEKYNSTANSSRASTSVAHSVSSISEPHDTNPIGIMQTTSFHSTMQGVNDPRMPTLSPFMHPSHSLPQSVSSSRSVNTEPSSHTMFMNHHGSFLGSTPASMNSTPAPTNYGRPMAFNNDFYQATSTAEMFVQQQMVPYSRSQQDMSPSPIPPSHYSGSVNAESDVVPPSSVMGRSMNELSLSRDTIAALQIKVQRALESLQGKEQPIIQQPESRSHASYPFSSVHMNFDANHSKMLGSQNLQKQRLPILNSYPNSETNMSAAASSYVDRSCASTPIMSRSAHNPSPASETNLILFASPSVDEISQHLRRTASDSIGQQSNPMNAYHQHQQRNHAWMMQKEGQRQQAMMQSHQMPHDPRFPAAFPLPHAGPCPVPQNQEMRSAPNTHPQQRTSPHPSTYSDAFPGFDPVMNSM